MENYPLVFFLTAVVLPLWLAAGFADYFCHRYSKIEETAGPMESALHLMSLFIIGIPVTLLLFFEANAGILALCLVCILLHHAIVFLDVHLADQTRRVTPVEQMLHSFLEILPITAFLLLGAMRWPQLLALFGAGNESARLAPELWPLALHAWYVAMVLGLAAMQFCLYTEELLRGFKARRRA